jgi:hypothetical protein
LNDFGVAQLNRLFKVSRKHMARDTITRNGNTVIGFGEQSNQFRLVQEIIIRSVSKTWEEAKPEWDLKLVYREDEPLTCLCGHEPINEICVLRNRRNGNSAEVGNVCVTKFLGLESDLIFSGLRRVAKDPDKALNKAATNYAHEQGWITDWERDFCLDTNRKRKLSVKQVMKRAEINRLVLVKTTNTYRAYE